MRDAHFFTRTSSNTLASDNSGSKSISYYFYLSDLQENVPKEMFELGCAMGNAAPDGPLKIRIDARPFSSLHEFGKNVCSDLQ